MPSLYLTTIYMDKTLKNRVLVSTLLDHLAEGCPTFLTVCAKLWKKVSKSAKQAINFKIELVLKQVKISQNVSLCK